MSTIAPRAVLVTRETEYELLLARHATRDQARFFLETRGQKLSDIEARHAHFQAVLHQARADIPRDWRQAVVKRASLDRFLFAADDIVVAIGQDGLVANVAKYLDAQPVLGIDPFPDLYDGVLVRFPGRRLAAALPAAADGSIAVEHRTMAQARLETGESLVALNELFIGHRSHQSARYRLTVDGQTEDQSSSGLIVATGTGSTGWARSIMEATSTRFQLGPLERSIAYFVREPFPSVATGTTLRAGRLETSTLSVTSRMNEGGVIFADGIEHDFLAFDWGRKVSLGPSERTLRLVVA